LRTFYQHTRSRTHKAALDYARRDIPVFPCEAGGKKPKIKDWPNRATTDPSRITAWWNRWPDANIGILTGERSGLLVVDVDHPAGPDPLEAVHGPLPKTRTHGTGSGGMHYLYRYPEGVEIRNSAGKLGEGLDVRGEGGYIIAPPSRTKRPYEVLDDLPLAEPPAWLLQALRRPESTVPGKVRTAATVSVERAGETIPVGTRNGTLTQIAGRLHDGTRGLAELEEELLKINGRRCAEPLPEAEVLKIAASIHRRRPCKKAAPAATPEVLEALDGIEAALRGRSWPGMRGKSSRSVVVALVKEARKHGTPIPAGVRVSISTRTLALAAGVSHRTLIRVVKLLREAKILRKDDADRSGTQAGAFVLVASLGKPMRASCHHSPTRGDCTATERASGDNLRAPFTAPRLRWSAPAYERVGDAMVRTTIRRLGKTCEAAVDILEAAGGEQILGDLYGRLHPDRQPGDRKRWRPRELRRRVLTKLEAAAVVECSGDTVRLTADWLEALNREREHAGEIEAVGRDMRRYEKDRLRHRVELLDGRGWSPDRIAGKVGISVEHVRQILKLPDSAPTERELARIREDYPERRRRAIERAIAELFRERPEYRGRRAGQVVCALKLPPDFPRGRDGAPKDAEVEEILAGRAA
jgi:Bifunctional DNA primase/polymerase, N-terminal/Primase C terminal 1 (PriCT-1)